MLTRNYVVSRTLVLAFVVGLAVMASLTTLASQSRAATPEASGLCTWKNTGLSPYLPIRDAPDTSGDIVGKIPYKAEFQATCGTDNGFVFVEDSYGYGWANRHYLTLISSSSSETTSTVVSAERVTVLSHQLGRVRNELRIPTGS